MQFKTYAVVLTACLILGFVLLPMPSHAIDTSHFSVLIGFWTRHVDRSDNTNEKTGMIALEAEWQSRKNKRQKKGEILPLYTVEDAEKAIHLLSPVERDQIIEVSPGIRARLRNAGHILGSSILELWIEEDGVAIKTVFSGDLGKQNQLIVKDPQEIFDADYLFVESTYGDRLHRTFEDSTRELLEAIQYSSSLNEPPYPLFQFPLQ